MSGSYGKLLEKRQRGFVREESLCLPSELELQSLFFAGHLGSRFTTQCGQNVEVQQLGEWNNAAGPDFLRCSVRIGNKTYHGPIELDLSPHHWEQHGHAFNPSFDDVVLHLSVLTPQKTTFIRSSQNRLIPQVAIPMERIRSAIGKPKATARVKLGRCSPALSHKTPTEIEDLLREAALYRAQNKAKRFSQTVAHHGFSQALWQSIATALGYHKNQLALTSLAQQLPIRKLRQKSPKEVEALLFGYSGFLESPSFESLQGESRRYVRSLWDLWWLHKPESRLRPLQWEFTSLRPQNHPQRRIAALAAVVKQWSQIERLSLSNPSELLKFLPKLNHEFWDHHFTLASQPSPKPISLFGKQRATDFLVNSVYPTLLSDDKDKYWPSYSKIRASGVNNRVKKAATRLFGNHPNKSEFLKMAWQHQGLLQIYQDFCLTDQTDCLQCPFPEQLIHTNSPNDRRTCRTSHA